MLCSAARRRRFPPPRVAAAHPIDAAPRCLTECEWLVPTSTQTSIASRQDQRGYNIVVSFINSLSLFYYVIKTLALYPNALTFVCPCEPSSNCTKIDASCPAIRRSRPR